MNNNDIIIKRVVLNYIKRLMPTYIKENYHLPDNFFDSDEKDDKSYNRDITYYAYNILDKTFSKAFFKLLNAAIDFNPTVLSNDVITKMFRENMLKDYYSLNMMNDFFDSEVNENVYTEHPELMKKEIVVDKTQKPSPVSKLIDVLQSKFHVDSNNIMTTSNNEIDVVKIFDISDYSYNALWINIADKEYELSEATTVSNLHILDLVCAMYGYERIMTQNKELVNGDVVISVVYHPAKPTEVLDSFKSCGYPVHFSPACNHESIMQYGIKTSYGERHYVYEDARAFYYLGADYEDDKSFMKMLGGMAKSYKKYVNPDFDGIYNIYELYSKNIKQDIKFYWDPNCNNCVYTNEVVKPTRIQLIGKVDMSNPKKPIFFDE